MRKQEKKEKGDNADKWLFGALGVVLGLQHFILVLFVGAAGAYVATTFFGDKKELIQISKVFTNLRSNQSQQNQNINNTANSNQIQTATTLGENENLLCPISQSLMTDPVTIKQCGHTFQRSEIILWLERQQFCPLCKVHAEVQDLVQNYTVKNLVDDAIKSGEVKK